MFYMTESEKWARRTPGVVALTAASDAAFVLFLKNANAALAVFRLLALTAIPANRLRYFKCRQWRNASARFRTRRFWRDFGDGGSVSSALCRHSGSSKEGTRPCMPMWALSSAIWWAAMLVLRVEAITTLVRYRRGAHV